MTEPTTEKPWPTECPTCAFPVGYGYGLAGGGIGAYVYCRCEGCERCKGECGFFEKRPDEEGER